jgi:hypothetical protein
VWIFGRVLIERRFGMEERKREGELVVLAQRIVAWCRFKSSHT